MVADVADFEIEPLPDSIVMARAKLSIDSLPAHAVRDGVIDLTGLKFYDRPDLNANFSLILRAFLAPVAGLSVWERATRPDEESDARLSTHKRLYLRVVNNTGVPLSAQNIPITIYGFAGAVRSGPPAAQPALIAQALEFTVTTEANVPLISRWEDVT